MTSLPKVVLAQALPQTRPRCAQRHVRASAEPLHVNLRNHAAVGLASVTASLTAARGAAAADSTAISSKVQAAELAVEQFAEVVKGASADSPLTKAVFEAEEALKEAEAAVVSAGTDSSALTQAVNEAAEAMKEASEAVARSGADLDVMSALAAATNAVQEAAVAALEASGVDAAAVAGAAAAGAGVATSVAQQAFTFFTTTEPAVLAEDALGAIAVAYITPPLARAGLTAARGYTGDVLPTTALDCLASDSGSVLVDIRAAAAKEAAGVPDLPDNGKLVEQEFVSLDGGEAELRDPLDVRAESTAVRIAALKKLNRNRTLYLMDEGRTGHAKAVARQLRKRGFNKVFVVSGGAEAWGAAKLSTRQWGPALLPPAAASKVEAAAA